MPFIGTSLIWKSTSIMYSIAELNGMFVPKWKVFYMYICVLHSAFYVSFPDKRNTFSALLRCPFIHILWSHIYGNNLISCYQLNNTKNWLQLFLPFISYQKCSLSNGNRTRVLTIQLTFYLIFILLFISNNSAAIKMLMVNWAHPYWAICSLDRFTWHPFSLYIFEKPLEMSCIKLVQLIIASLFEFFTFPRFMPQTYSNSRKTKTHQTSRLKNSNHINQNFSLLLQFKLYRFSCQLSLEQYQDLFDVIQWIVAIKLNLNTSLLFVKAEIVHSIVIDVNNEQIDIFWLKSHAIV